MAAKRSQRAMLNGQYRVFKFNLFVHGAGRRLLQKNEWLLAVVSLSFGETNQLLAGYAVFSHRSFHMATAFYRCPLSQALVILLQDLHPCLAYKAPSGYLLSFALDISNEKRQEVKELIERKNRSFGFIN